MSTSKTPRARDQLDAARALALMCANMSGEWQTREVCGTMSSLKGSVIVRAFDEAGWVENVKRTDRGNFYITRNPEMLLRVARGEEPIPAWTGNTHNKEPEYTGMGLLEVFGYMVKVPKRKGRRVEVRHNTEEIGRSADLPLTMTYLEQNT